MKKTFFAAVLILLISALIFSVCAKSPAESVTLKFASAGPPTHFLNLVYDEYIDKVTELSDGKVQFETYWGGSLAGFPAEYDSVVNHVADMSSAMPGYTPGRFPVAELMELPWGYPVDTTSTSIFYEVITKFKPAEIKDVHFIFGAASAYPVIISNKPIHTMADLKGMTIRATGNAVKIVEALGGTSVSMPISDVYEALQKHTVDGCMTMMNTLQPFKLAEAVKYCTETPCVGYASTCWVVMNLETWNSLSDDTQKLLSGLSEEWSMKMGTAWSDANAINKQYAIDKGVEMIELTPEEQAKWGALIKPIRDAYIADEEAKGVSLGDIANFIEESLAK